MLERGNALKWVWKRVGRTGVIVWYKRLLFGKYVFFYKCKWINGVLVKMNISKVWT